MFMIDLLLLGHRHATRGRRGDRLKVGWRGATRGRRMAIRSRANVMTRG
jgi:hypothetical protein